MFEITNKSAVISSVDLVRMINGFRKEECDLKAKRQADNGEVITVKHTELDHANFLKSVDKEIETMELLGLDGAVNFYGATYTDKQNKQRRCFHMTRDGALQMLNKESTYVRVKTVQYVDELENTAPALTVEQKMVLDIVFPQDDVQQALAVQVYGNYKYNSGHEVGYTEGHEVGYTQGHIDGYTECGKTEYITTTKVVRLINERAGGSFNGHKLTTIELFEWLEYLGYGEYKLPHEKAGKRKFFASQEFMDILLEDKLGQVNVINGRHEIKWTKEWASTVGLDNIGGWLKNRGTKSFK